MIVAIIIAVIGAGFLIRHLLKKKPKKVDYVSEFVNLTNEEFDFYERLTDYNMSSRVNRGSLISFIMPKHPEKYLIIDRVASEQARKFADYCFALDKPVRGHVGVGNRISTLTSKGATSVAEIYSGGYRALDTAIQRLKESEKHNKVMTGNYTHIGVGVTGKHYVAIYFNIK